MATKVGGWQGAARHAACFMLLVSPLSLMAQDEQDVSSVTALVHEVVEKIHADAYRDEPTGDICTKALGGLIAGLGAGAQSHQRSFSSMLPAAAEAEFVQTLQNIAAAPGQRHSLRDLAEMAIQAWCRQHDPYTRYTRSDDVKMLELLTKATGSGIGMSILEKDGAFLCFPLPGSPAAAAGVKAGNKLISVDGKSVQGRPLDYLAAVIRGAPGTEVSLRVLHDFNREQTFRITRETLTTPSVLVTKKLSGLSLQIRKFSKEMPGEARAALAQFSPGTTLRLDLRGCSGGDLDVAIAFAAMFLEPGEPIVTVRTRGRPDEVNKATKPREFKPGAVICEQDAGTASAAELIIAALVHSPSARGASTGTKTYGKGLWQVRHKLNGGGILVITTGELIAPQGFTWDAIGLLPSMDSPRGRIFP